MAVIDRAGVLQASQGRNAWRLAWWPAAALLLAEIAAFLNNPGVSFEPPWLLAPLGAIFQVAIPLFVAGAAVSAYRATGVAAVLAVGAGMLGYALAGGVLPSVFLAVRGVNEQVAIHNWGLLLVSACCLLASPLMPLAISIPMTPGSRVRQAVLAYGLAISVVAALAGLTLSGIIPPFHRVETGFTPLREAVLGLSLGLFLVSAAAWWQTSLHTQLDFARWYALGLLLFAIGVLGVLIETEPGDPVSWVGRAAQFIAAPYFLAAVLTAGRERGFAIELVQSALPYRPLLESISDAVVALNREGGIMYWNRAARRLFGYDSPEVFGRDLFEMIAPKADLAEARQRIASLLGAADRAATGARLELTLADRTGREFPAELAFHPNLSAIGGLNVWVAHDISERKWAEEELRRHRARLEEMVAARTAELATANRELEGFSYAMSHVLSAPLRAIDGYAHLLIEDYAAKFDDEGRRRLELISSNARDMSQIIDDVLSFLRLGRQPLRLTSTDMERLVREVLAQRTPDIKARRIDIKLGELPSAPADPEMVALVWRSLIDNAIKFTSPRATPLIEIGAIRHANEIVFFVRDNGVGFDMQYAPKLFGVFYRAHGAEFAGNGMGLAAVQRIVVKHGGRAWAESAPGQGATFSFSLPTTRRAAAAKAPAKPPPGPSARPRS